MVFVNFDEDGCPEIDPIPTDPGGPDGQPRVDLPKGRWPTSASQTTKSTGWE